MIIESAAAAVISAIEGWCVKKGLDALSNQVNTKLNPDDVKKAIKIGIEAAQKEHSGLFYRCQPDFISRFLNQFFDQVSSELVQPKKPDIDFFKKAFEQAAENDKRFADIEQNLVKPWLEIFTETYFQQTQAYLKFQVAKENYFKQLNHYFNDIKFAGMSVEGQEIDKSDTLIKIFVMPNVSEEKTGYQDTVYNISEKVFRPQDNNYLINSSQEVSVIRWENSSFSQTFLANELLTHNDKKKSVLLGAPGSGKSSLLSYFAVMVANNKVKEIGLSEERDWLPILIPIRNLVREKEINLLDYAKTFTQKVLQTKPLPDGFFEYWLEDGRAIILLDGLDEIAEEAKRYQIVKQINNFLNLYSENIAIISSRPDGYKRDFFKTDQFPHYQLQSFDDDQIEIFINNWYSSRIADPDQRERSKESLRKALDDHEKIKSLGRNPLLLTIIALIHRYQALLPKKRYELYHKAVETLLLTWDANKELTGDTIDKVLKYLKLDDLRRLLEVIAYWVHCQGNGNQQGGTIVKRDDLMEKLATEIKTRKQIELYQAKEEAKRFLDFIRERTGLLNEQGIDCYGFVHKTFQEYLCAQEIDYQADNEGDFDIILDHIRNHLHDPHWREVLLLLIAQQKPKKAAKAIKEVLLHNSEYEQWLHRDLFFAGACLAEDIKDLRVADNELVTHTIDDLIALEVSEGYQVGRKIKAEVMKILCSCYETDFEQEILSKIKERLIINPNEDIEQVDFYRNIEQIEFYESLELKEMVKLERLLRYQYCLGEQNDVINYILKGLKRRDFIENRRWMINNLVEFFAKSSLILIVSEMRKFLETIDQDNDYQDFFLEIYEIYIRILIHCQKQSIPVMENDNFLLEYPLLIIDPNNKKFGLFTKYYLSMTIGYSYIDKFNNTFKEEGLYISVNNISIISLSAISGNFIKKLSKFINESDDFYASFDLSIMFLEHLKLEQLPSDIIELLIRELHDDEIHEDDCVTIIKILKQLKNPSERIIQIFKEWLEYDDYYCYDDPIQLESIKALVKFKVDSTDIFELLRQVSESKNRAYSVRLQATVALAKLGDYSENIIQSLINYLGDPYNSYEPTSTLVELHQKSDQVKPLLIEWIKQQQDSNYVGNGIDALWDIIQGEDGTM